MANPKEDTKKQADPSVEEKKRQAAAYEALEKKASSYEELKKETDAYEEMKRQARAYGELKKRISPSWQEEIPYGTPLRTLREKLNMLASDTNSDINEIAQCIKAITFFENQQARELAELKKESQKSSGYYYDNQSILQTSSVRKKDPRALDIVKKESDLR
jgi:hypothetical protein